MNTIIKNFQKKIIDNNSNNIQYSFTTTKNLLVLHIYNPSLESISIKNNENKDKPFYKKLAKMLLDRNKKTKIGCFNYEHMDDDDILYKYNNEELVNRFLNITYTFILIDLKYNPLSLLAIDNSTIYNVCTNIRERGKNYMTYLFTHILKLIKLKNLKIAINYDDLKLNIRHINPYKEKLIEFYKKFNFVNIDYNNGIYITMYIK
jgi:hypothetical protein